MMINNNFIVKAVLVALVFSVGSFKGRANTLDPQECFVGGNIINGANGEMKFYSKTVKVSGFILNNGKINTKMGESTLKNINGNPAPFTNRGELNVGESSIFNISAVTNGFAGSPGSTPPVAPDPGDVIVVGTLNIKNSVAGANNGDLFNNIGSNVVVKDGGFLNIENFLTNSSSVSVMIGGKLSVLNNVENKGAVDISGKALMNKNLVNRTKVTVSGGGELNIGSELANNDAGAEFIVDGSVTAARVGNQSDATMTVNGVLKSTGDLENRGIIIFGDPESML